jgi:histidyl-tRNA synthetase
LKKQLEEASKRGYMFTAILAPEELSRNELIVRNMESGSEVKVKLDEFMKEPKAALKT